MIIVQFKQLSRARVDTERPRGKLSEAGGVL